MKTRIFLEKSANHGPIEETIYTSNLENAKNIFLDKLRELDCETIENVYSKVTQHFLFNIYSLDKEIDTYVAFETMNNRGKPLSHLELLKNRLIYLTTKLKEEQYEKDDLRHSINECWKSIYHYLGKSKDNPLDDDEFLYSHFTLYFDNQIDSFDFNYRSPRQLRKEYKTLLLDDIFSQKSLSDDSDVQINIDYINKYVSNLKDSVEHWYDIFNPSDNKLGCDVSKTLNKIHKIRRWVDAAPLILSVFRITSSSDERLRFLQVLERGLYIENYIYSRYSLFTKSDFVKLAKDINLHKTTPENLISSITTKVDESLKQQRQIWTKEFSKSSDFYNWMGIRYTLYEYEMSLLKKYKSDRTKLTWTDESATEPWTEYVSVEHIYPQHPKHAYWIDRFNHLSAPIRKKLRHCIGNLVPLSKSKNSSLSNKPFHHKASEGYAFGCYSENEVAKCDDWTPAQIIERTITLVKFMDQRWKLGIGNSTDAYLEFAGLKDISI
ncbi:DUF1524 domain-containing protein [Aeromonas sp. R2-4]|uniref:GmrSD restriction endonuclease domain-containing protein n=1 Tax=Aeromonas sp. R2-4 TaxID=3138462 RepID=UPI0034A452A4